jgi:hypothetical protein
MGGRTDQQCMGRWRRHLDPTVTRSAWTSDEDKSLASLHGELGPKWSLICQSIPGRTAQQCRARWFQTEGKTTQQDNSHNSQTSTGHQEQRRRMPARVALSSVSTHPSAMEQPFQQILGGASSQIAGSLEPISFMGGQSFGSLYDAESRAKHPTVTSTAMDPMMLWRDVVDASAVLKRHREDDEIAKRKLKVACTSPSRIHAPKSASMRESTRRRMSVKPTTSQTVSHGDNDKLSFLYSVALQGGNET